MVIRTCLLLGMVLGYAGNSQAASLSPDEAVEIAARAMLAAGVQDASPVAPSRPMPGCKGDVTAGPRQGRWSTVELSCAKPRWTRALRTRAAALAPLAPAADAAYTETEAQPAVMALGLSHSMGKGAMIAADDLVTVAQDTRAPDEVYTDPSFLIGRRLRQSVAPGRPILARHLEPDWIVEQEGPVVIVSQTGGISISVAGRANSNAALGDLVDVTNLSSGRNVMARVIGKDLVAVTLKPSGNGS